MTPPPLDILFLASEDAPENAARLAALLQEVTPAQILVVAAEASLVTQLTATQPSTAVWVRCLGRQQVGGVARALQLTQHDVLLSMPHGLPVPGCCQQLDDVLRANAHAAVIMPGAVETAKTAGPMANLPARVEVVAPDVPLALYRHEALQVVGGLDTTFVSLLHALADWSMRAQCFGMMTYRAPRALVAVHPHCLAALPADGKMLPRHPGYALRRRRAASDITTRLPQSCLQSARSGISVCIDLRHLPEDAVNGTGVYGTELCKALVRYTAARVCLLVATLQQQRALACLAVPCYLEGQQVPSVHVVHRPAQVFRSRDLLFLLQMDAPLVLSYQDMLAYRAPSVFATMDEHEQYCLVTHLAVRSAQRIIAISADNRRDLMDSLHVPAEKIDVVHHGVHASWYADNDKQRNVACLQPLQLNETFFLYVGSDYAHKNIRTLLAAYAQVRYSWQSTQRVPDLVLVGHPSGTLDGAYPHLRRDPMPGVRYVGTVSDLQLRALYQSAVALVYPSTYEGFGMPLLEAMAAGCPVICSTYTSLPEVAGDAARYVTPLDDRTLAAALVEVASNPQERPAWVERGQRRAAAFTWSATAKRTYASYENALAAPSALSLYERRMALPVAEQLLAPDHDAYLRTRMSQQRVTSP